MLQKSQGNTLNAHEKQYEMIRYLIAGGPDHAFKHAHSLRRMLPDGAAAALHRRPRRLDSGQHQQRYAVQLSIASTVSWVIAVLFAFWINRGMVFRVEGAHGRLKELIQFASSRFVSFLVFEQGLMLLLEAIGIENLENRVIVLVFVMVFNYVVSKFWIFKKNGETKPRA